METEIKCITDYLLYFDSFFTELKKEYKIKRIQYRQIDLDCFWFFCIDTNLTKEEQQKLFVHLNIGDEQIKIEQKNNYLFVQIVA